MRTRVLFTLFLVPAVLLLGAVSAVGDVPVTEAQALTPEERARLQAEYDQLQQEIAGWQKILDETRAKKNTLQGDVTALNAQIKKAESEIRQRNLTVTRLASEIRQKSEHIASLEARLLSGRESLAELLREKDEVETSSLALLMFSAENLSEFFSSVDAVDVINRRLQQHFAELRSVQEETERERQALDTKRNEELDAKYEVEAKKKEVSKAEAEKKQLLTITSQEEKSYSQVLAERQRRAETIRSALFDLRDAQGISFAKALEYADMASQATGVRTAMILAILSQESDLGKNIGSCYVTNIETGDGAGKNTGTLFERVMKAPRDTVPFQEITSALGLNWGSTPVSCPLGQTYSASRGYGGAMGPSQFIPSTWKIFETRLKTSLGVSLPNPWDPKHAIMATALYLADLGADGGTYTAERNAACRYYSGRACDTRRPTNYTYGNAVISKAESFQEDIDFLKGI